MTAEIVALSCIFEGDQTNSNAFCVIEEGHARLQELGDSIAGKPEKLVGLYVPLIVQPEDEPIRDYDPTMRGRVIALVRALPMPRNKTIRDYYSDDPRTLRLFRGQLVHRWPVGWPSETVFYSANGPALKDACDMTGHVYADLTHRFLKGPIDLQSIRFKTLRNRLMAEIEHRVAHQPETIIREF
jgi:hypothetical protein